MVSRQNKNNTNKWNGWKFNSNIFIKTISGHDIQSEIIIENKYFLFIVEIFLKDNAAYPDKNKKKINDATPLIAKIKFLSSLAEQP